MENAHGEPVIIGSDTNSIDRLEADVSVHMPKMLEGKVELSDTLNMETGEAIENAGLE